MRRRGVANRSILAYAIFFLIAGCPALPCSSAPLIIRYPSVVADDAYIIRTRYSVEVLSLILDKARVDYRLQPIPVSTIPESRVSVELRNGRYDVCWMHTNTNRESKMLPVRIPISRGLLGWRISLISPHKKQAFSQAKTLTDLRAFLAGQGHDWPDTRILRANNMQVITSVNRESLVAMLTRDRIDYFPRSIAEIWDELDMHKNLKLVVEPKFAFWYPTADYFFVRNDNHELANLLTRGFELAIADGSFMKLFDNHFASLIQKAKLEKRVILHLENPYIPSETPLSRLALWYMPPGVDLLTAIASN